MIAGLPPFYNTNRQKMYRAILDAPLKRPEVMSPAAFEVIKGFLQRDPTQRLGYDGMAKMKVMEWFSNCGWGEGWAQLEAKEVEPPFKPTVNGAADTGLIDPEFLREEVRRSKTSLELACSCECECESPCPCPCSCSCLCSSVLAHLVPEFAEPCNKTHMLVHVPVLQLALLASAMSGFCELQNSLHHFCILLIDVLGSQLRVARDSFVQAAISPTPREGVLVDQEAFGGFTYDQNNGEALGE